MAANVTIFLDLLQVYFFSSSESSVFFISIFRGNAKEERLKTRRDGGKGRKEGGGENPPPPPPSFLPFPPVSPRFQSFLLRIASEDTDEENRLASFSIFPPSHCL